MTKTIDDTFFKEHIPERHPDAHKGDFGRVLIFAGSRGMAGAAVLCGRAAVRSGAGLVRFLLPSFEDPIYPIFQICVPEATCVTPEQIQFYYPSELQPGIQTDSALTPESADLVSGRKAPLNEYTAIAAGSGLGNDAARRNLLRFILNNYNGTLLLDADALNIIAAGSIPEHEVRSSQAKIILTPHIGEAKRLLGTTAPIRSREERFNAARKLSEKFGCTALLKGRATLVVSESGDVYENTTGNPGMAAGGSGDTLSGIIAALAASGLSPQDAAACGAFIHGKAGDLAAEELGEACMKAGDITDYLPAAWNAAVSQAGTAAPEKQ